MSNLSDTDTPKTTAPKAKKRLNLDLTPEAYALLQKLSNESGKNMADVLRTGLALYGIAQEEEQKGRNLAVVDENDKVIKQIVAV
jgi:alanine racemase